MQRAGRRKAITHDCGLSPGVDSRTRAPSRFPPLPRRSSFADGRRVPQPGWCLARAEGTLERSVQFDIREPVDQLLARTAEQASANGLILSYAEGSDQPIYVDGDPDALAIAIRNLVDNALRYTPRGGRVRVHLTSEQSQVRLSVEDSGPGVPSKERDAIFTPLARGASKVIDRKPEGYGLGLAIARRIVERHGGSLSVEAAEGGGARFLIQVPVAAAGREPALPAQT